ncbi:MAG: hypothetical protein GMKNLPBB_00381 [Myxococcota bacterium]|nr:hypothetical protein [Myxococcota bacterium]
MNWTLFLSTFTAIFVAEIGDKTQLAAMTLSAGGASRWTVFAGASLALVATTAMAVAGGELIGRMIPLVWIRRGAGVIFIVMGVLYLLSPGEPGETNTSGAGESSPENREPA